MSNVPETPQTPVRLTCLCRELEWCVAMGSFSDSESYSFDGNGIEVVSMRRMFSVCSRWVARYRLLCWIGSVGATVGAPMVGWLSHLADVSSVRSSLLEDDPESASEVVDGSFVDWLFSSSWSSGLVLAVIASGIVFLLLLVLFTVFAGKGAQKGVFEGSDGIGPEIGGSKASEGRGGADVEDVDDYGVAAS